MTACLLRHCGYLEIKSNTQLYCDSKSKAEILSRQFQSVFTREDTTTSIPTLPGIPYPTLPGLQITSLGVEKLLRQINPTKASRPDELPNRILKETATTLAPYLAAIFTQSLSSGQLPQDWLDANISPAYKKGNRHEPVNNCPISLTSVCCKTMEHIMCTHIRRHLDTHNVLTSLQHRFRKMHYCDTQLLITVNDLMSYHDKKIQVDAAILDFSNGFDVVPH